MLFGTKVKIISYHRPATFGINEELSEIVPNTYQEKFTKKITYLSDSRGVWSQGHPFEHQTFKKKGPFQLLIHPVWWATDEQTNNVSRLRDTLVRKNMTTKLALLDSVDFLRSEQLT